jgi:hypothetical protein
MLRAKEDAPTPSPSVVVTFELIIKSLKELRGTSIADFGKI